MVALPANAGGPQIIILSHDGLLEKYFDTLSQDADWHHQRLQGLPPRGAILTQEQDADRLRALAESFLQAGQTEQASPLMRQYLEYSLLQIIRKVNVPVPIDFSIRDDRKMVENCLQAIGAAVALHKKAGTLILESSQETAFKGTHLPQLLGNG